MASKVFSEIKDFYSVGVKGGANLFIGIYFKSIFHQDAVYLELLSGKLRQFLGHLLTVQDFVSSCKTRLRTQTVVWKAFGYNVRQTEEELTCISWLYGGELLGIMSTVLFSIVQDSTL